VDQECVYFSEYESGAVNKVPKQGGRVTTLASGEIGAYALVVRDGRVYWTNPPSQAVLSIAVAGGEPEALPVPEGMYPWALAADRAGIYFTDHTSEGAVVQISAEE
jgi:streptogramin lyase